jgi:hypothetical protein
MMDFNQENETRYRNSISGSVFTDQTHVIDVIWMVIKLLEEDFFRIIDKNDFKVS